MIEVVSLGTGPPLEGAGLPASVAGVVFSGRAGQDELHVSPGQIGVGGAHQGGHPRHGRRCRRGAGEAGGVVVVIGGGGDAANPAARGTAHPQVGA